MPHVGCCAATAVAQQADCTGPSATCGFAPFVLKLNLGADTEGAVYRGPRKAVPKRHVVLYTTEMTLVAADEQKFSVKVGPSAFDGNLVLLREVEPNSGEGPAFVEGVPLGTDVFVFAYDAVRGRSHLLPIGELVLPLNANAGLVPILSIRRPGVSAVVVER